MQRQICVAANPVIVAAYVLCNCDRQWMVETQCFVQFLTSICIWCVLFTRKIPTEARELHTQKNDNDKIS